MDPMLEEFQAELYDKYYPQIMEGVERMENGEVADGIEILARPLHTIKGVTGFMAGFEDASRFTHKVESFLKKLQSGELDGSDENVAPAVRAVNLVFQVIEQIKDEGGADQTEMDEVLGLLEARLAGDEEGGPSAEFDVKVEAVNGVAVLRVGTPRVHLASHRAPLTEALESLQEGMCVLLDLNKVISFNSTSWEAVESFVEKLKINACGLSQASKEALYGWGFDKSVSVYASEDDFFNDLA